MKIKQIIAWAIVVSGYSIMSGMLLAAVSVVVVGVYSAIQNEDFINSLKHLAVMFGIILLILTGIIVFFIAKDYIRDEK